MNKICFLILMFTVNFTYADDPRRPCWVVANEANKKCYTEDPDVSYMEMHHCELDHMRNFMSEIRFSMGKVYCVKACRQ